MNLIPPELINRLWKGGKAGMAAGGTALMLYLVRVEHMPVKEALACMALLIAYLPSEGLSDFAKYLSAKREAPK
jgi:hypothetical protein